MAFNTQKFTVLAYANGFTLWAYETKDTPEKMAKIGYWDGAYKMVREGDMFLVTTKGDEEFGTIWLVECRDDTGHLAVEQKTSSEDAI
jgi:hypothetical protein